MSFVKAIKGNGYIDYVLENKSKLRLFNDGRSFSIPPENSCKSVCKGFTGTPPLLEEPVQSQNGIDWGSIFDLATSYLPGANQEVPVEDTPIEEVPAVVPVEDAPIEEPYIEEEPVFTIMPVEEPYIEEEPVYHILPVGDPVPIHEEPWGEIPNSDVFLEDIPPFVEDIPVQYPIKPMPKPVSPPQTLIKPMPKPTPKPVSPSTMVKPIANPFVAPPKPISPTQGISGFVPGFANLGGSFNLTSPAPLAQNAPRGGPMFNAGQIGIGKR